MKSEGSITSATLLLRLGHHPSDQAAWEEFVDRYGGMIYSWCRATGLQDADAQDVTQAVLTQLAVQLRRFAYDPSQRFRGWLRTLVKNACRDCVADMRHRIGVVALGGTGMADPILTVPRATTWPGDSRPNSTWNCSRRPSVACESASLPIPGKRTG